jgi:hypothetical protein
MKEAFGVEMESCSFTGSGSVAHALYIACGIHKIRVRLAWSV